MREILLRLECPHMKARTRPRNRLPSRARDPRLHRTRGRPIGLVVFEGKAVTQVRSRATRSSWRAARVQIGMRRRGGIAGGHVDQPREDVPARSSVIVMLPTASQHRSLDPVTARGGKGAGRPVYTVV